MDGDCKLQSWVWQLCYSFFDLLFNIILTYLSILFLNSIFIFHKGWRRSSSNCWRIVPSFDTISPADGLRSTCKQRHLVAMDIIGEISTLCVLHAGGTLGSHRSETKPLLINGVAHATMDVVSDMVSITALPLMSSSSRTP